MEVSYLRYNFIRQEFTIHFNKFDILINIEQYNNAYFLRDRFDPWIL